MKLGSIQVRPKNGLMVSKSQVFAAKWIMEKALRDGTITVAQILTPTQMFSTTHLKTVDGKFLWSILNFDNSNEEIGDAS